MEGRGGETHRRQLALQTGSPICCIPVSVCHFSIQEFASPLTVVLRVLHSRASESFRELWKGIAGRVSQQPGISQQENCVCCPGYPRLQDHLQAPGRGSLQGAEEERPQRLREQGVSGPGFLPLRSPVPCVLPLQAGPSLNPRPAL